MIDFIKRQHYKKTIAILVIATVVAIVLSMTLPYRVEVKTDSGMISLGVSLNRAEASSTLTLRPNQAGTYTQLTPSTGRNYQCVDETSVGDTDYVYMTGNSYLYDTYALQNHSTETGAISSVTVYFRCKGVFGYSPTAQPMLRLTPNNATGSKQSLGSSYSTFNQVISRPGGGSWSWTDIDNLQAGVTLYAGGGSVSAYCSWLYIVVTYNTPTYAISNSSSSFDFGTVQASTTYYSGGGAYSNPVTDGQCYFTVTNGDSYNAVKVNIKESNPTGGVGWTLTSGSPGSNTIRDTAVVSGTNPANGVVLSTSDQVLISSLAASSTKKWDLKRETGTFTDGDQKTSTITLTGVAP